MSVEVLFGFLKDDRLSCWLYGLVRRACSPAIYVRIRGRLIVTRLRIGYMISLQLNIIVHKAYFS